MNPHQDKLVAATATAEAGIDILRRLQAVNARRDKAALLEFFTPDGRIRAWRDYFQMNDPNAAK
jgi:limonene-1,2-epoxide hydrolase